MDKVDKLLISLLQENARYSLKELSEKVYLSSPAVASRIARLEEKGLITGYHAEINPKKLGYHVTAYINVSMQPKRKQAFIPFIKEFRNVIECSEVAGDNSVTIKAMFADTDGLREFIENLQKFGHTETQIVLSEFVAHRGISVEI